MPKLDGTGPEKKGAGTGRRLGECSDSSDDDNLQKLGKGMGQSRKSEYGKGKGKRLKSGK